MNTHSASALQKREQHQIDPCEPNSQIFREVILFIWLKHILNNRPVMETMVIDAKKNH